MIEPGKVNTLEIVKEVDFGVYLDGGDLGEILMPKRYVAEGLKPGDKVEIFLYFDSEDRIIATTEEPFVQVGEFALLRCVAVNKFGAFMDWGLMKELLVPFREQRQNLEEGRSYVVYVYLDLETQRIVASAKIDKHLDNIPPEFVPGQEVDLLIYGQSELGYKAIINGLFSGILYKNEVFKRLDVGQKTKGYIKKVRDDEKIDLLIHKPGHQKLDAFSEKIISHLKENHGFMTITDKSDPELIYSTFGISKKNFKKAIGGLYKQRLIEIEIGMIKLP